MLRDECEYSLMRSIIGRCGIPVTCDAVGCSNMDENGKSLCSEKNLFTEICEYTYAKFREKDNFDNLQSMPDPRYLNVLSNQLGKESPWVESVKFADRASLKNFLDHLIRNNCTDYDIEKVRKASDLLWENE
jgi:hypothetical protein